MSKDIRAKIIKRIQAMMNVTTERGATEQETQNATQRIAVLMQEHELTFKDVEGELRQESYGAMGKNFFGKQKHDVRSALRAIAAFWNCKVWISNKTQIVFFGECNDVENAHMMAIMMRITMDNEVSRFMAKPSTSIGRIHGKTIRSSFLKGMAHRISERLYEFVAEREKANKTVSAAGTSTALVVQVKNQIVQEKFETYTEQNDLRIKAAARAKVYVDDNSYDAGMKAGSMVDLGSKKVGPNSKLMLE
jgi:hypothetical protein